jgi:hypothetical protein
MAAAEPHATNLADLYELAPLEWDDVRRPLEAKARNVERNPHCALGVAVHGYDIALEGRAHRVTDESMLQTLAAVFAEGGWAPTVAGGGFTHEFSAPSAGPPPWYVYEVTLENVYAVATKEPGGATRWSF